MKAKIQTLIRFLLLVGFSVVFFFGLLFIFDDLLNGMLAEWFDRSFVKKHYTYGGVMVRDLNWNSLKEYIKIFTAILVALWTATIAIAIYLTRKRTERKTIKQAGGLVREYMEQNKDALEIFPEGYEDLSAQMTELKTQILLNEQLIRDEATRKNDLIAYLAHDLKTPLTSIIGYLSLLVEAPEMPSEQKAKYMHISLDKALRLESLINEFFEITRFNLSEPVLEKETIDLSYMLIQLTDEFYPILKEHDNTIKVNIDEKLVVYADSNKLARVFNNLLKNAAAYSYAGTEIIVTAKEINTNILISFSNYGKTIPHQKLQSIFEKFYRLDEARATNTGGAGLGLAIAKEIIENHGGRISAVSENEITTFTVSLPKVKN